MLSATSATDADHRRAVSNAYYGLFHMLVDEAVALVCPAQPQSLSGTVRRGFQHIAMNDVCKSVGQGRKDNLADALKPVFSDPIEPELATVAKVFVALRANRHRADYAPNETISWAQADDAVQKARHGFAQWQIVRGSDNAHAFLMALLLAKQWRSD
jgi:uncharacterized protein (UPF0332 family)